MNIFLWWSCLYRSILPFLMTEYFYYFSVNAVYSISLGYMFRNSTDQRPCKIIKLTEYCQNALKFLQMGGILTLGVYYLLLRYRMNLYHNFNYFLFLHYFLKANKLITVFWFNQNSFCIYNSLNDKSKIGTFKHSLFEKKRSGRYFVVTAKLKQVSFLVCIFLLDTEDFLFSFGSVHGFWLSSKEAKVKIFEL